MYTGFRQPSENRGNFSASLKFILLWPEGRREYFGRCSTLDYLNCDFY